MCPRSSLFFFFSLLVALLCSQSHRIRWSFAASPSSRSEPERGRATTAPAPSASIRLNLPPLLPFPTIACTLEYGANVRRDRDGPAVDPGPPALELTERRNQQPRLAHSCSFVRYSYSDSYFRQTSPPSCVCACACACACVCVWHWVVVCTRSNSLTYSLSVVERTTNVSPLHPEVERRILLSSSWGISIDRELRGQKKKRDKYRQRHWPRSQAWKSHALRTFHTYLLVHTYILIHTPHTYPYIPIHTYHTYIHTYNRYYSPPPRFIPPPSPNSSTHQPISQSNRPSDIHHPTSSATIPESGSSTATRIASTVASRYHNRCANLNLYPLVFLQCSGKLYSQAHYIVYRFGVLQTHTPALELH